MFALCGGRKVIKQLPPAEDRVVHIFMVDLLANRVEKMSKVQYKVKETDEGSSLVHVCIIAFGFHSSEQTFVLTPSIEQEVVISGVEDGGQAATVMLSVLILGESTYNGPQSFASILELWKFLEICLTGNYEDTDIYAYEQHFLDISPSTWHKTKVEKIQGETPLPLPPLGQRFRDVSREIGP